MRRGGCLRGGFAGLPDGCQAAAGMKHIVNFDAGALRAACMAASQHTPGRCGNGGSDAPAALCVRGGQGYCMCRLRSIVTSCSFSPISFMGSGSLWSLR